MIGWAHPGSDECALWTKIEKKEKEPRRIGSLSYPTHEKRQEG